MINNQESSIRLKKYAIIHTYYYIAFTQSTLHRIGNRSNTDITEIKYGEITSYEDTKIVIARCQFNQDVNVIELRMIEAI